MLDDAFAFSDLLWCVMTNLSGKEIALCRTVCKAWCDVVDSVSKCFAGGIEGVVHDRGV